MKTMAVFTITELPDVIGVVVALVLTVAVLSQLAGDNGLLRLAQSLMVGTTGGYILALVWRTVILPRALLLFQAPAQYWYYAFFFILGILLLGRGLRKTTALASLPLGILFGIGAALVLGGALAGTVIPLVRSLYTPFSSNTHGTEFPLWSVLVNAGLVVIGTLAVLGMFHITLPRHGLSRFLVIAWTGLGKTLGQGLVMITLGALYAGAVVSFYTLLSSRLLFLYEAIRAFIAQIGV